MTADAGPRDGRLTTHVLDTMSGQPGAGLRIELFRVGDGAEQQLAAVTTNDDGRCAAPLLAGDSFRPGVYELRFHVGAYFTARGVEPTDFPFLDVVPIRFGIAAADQHYHVPLLISPFGYSTYRGS